MNGLVSRFRRKPVEYIFYGSITGGKFPGIVSAIYIEVTEYRNTAAEAKWQSRPAGANISFSEIRHLASPSPDILYDHRSPHAGGKHTDMNDFIDSGMGSFAKRVRSSA